MSHKSQRTLPGPSANGISRDGGSGGAGALLPEEGSEAQRLRDDAIAAKLAEFWCSSAVLSASSCASAERPRSQHRRAACGAEPLAAGGDVRTSVAT